MKTITLKQYKQRIVANLFEVKRRRTFKEYIKKKFFEFMYKKMIDKLMENSIGVGPIMNIGTPLIDYGYTKPYKPKEQ